MKKLSILFLSILSITMFAQTPQDQQGIKEIFNEALSKGKSYDMLKDLCLNIGPRLSGSPGAAAAVEWSRHLMEQYDFDSVWLQPVMVPHWVRGDKEIARVLNSKKMGMVNLTICALGNSVGTGPNGVSAKVVEVKSFDE